MRLQRERALCEYADHRPPIFFARVDICVDVGDFGAGARRRLFDRFRRRALSRKCLLELRQADSVGQAPVKPIRADWIFPPLTSSAAAMPTIA